MERCLLGVPAALANVWPLASFHPSNPRPAPKIGGNECAPQPFANKKGLVG